MHSLPDFASLAVSALSPALAGALIASIWQGLLLTLAVALTLRLLPALSAAARSAVWTAVLLLVIALPFLSVAFPHTTATGSGVLHLEETVSFAIVALWAAAAAVRALQLAASAVRLHGILRRAQPVGVPAAVAHILRSTTRPVTVCSSADIDRPSVAGFLRPRILFPPELLAELTEAELAHIVLHETEHLRRRDDWINLLQQLSLVLFPLNPALLWLNRRLSLERELACDDGVLAATRARKAYAACLARVAENSLVRRSAALVLGVLGTWTRKPELARRVERILRSPGKSLSPAQMRFATGGLLALIVGSTGLLAHSPRLVSFTPAMPAYARAAEAGAFDLPASHIGLPHPTLVKAILPAHGAPLPPPAAFRAVSVAPGRRQLRVAAHRRPARETAPWVVLTSFHQPAAPVARLTAFVFEDSQTWYTAVAVRGGWIVVQL